MLDGKLDCFVRRSVGSLSPGPRLRRTRSMRRIEGRTLSGAARGGQEGATPAHGTVRLARLASSDASLPPMSAITALPEAPPDENGPRLGADVARDLGWPPSDVGLIGAAGALLDLGSKFRRTRSSMSLVRRYR